MITSEKEECVLVRWTPSRSSVVANLTLVAMTAGYAILGANPGNTIVLMVIGLIVVPVLSIGVPIYWVTQVERQPISSMGLTLHRWLPSLVLSMLLSLVVVFPLILNHVQITTTAWLPMAAAGLCHYLNHYSYLAGCNCVSRRISVSCLALYWPGLALQFIMPDICHRQCSTSSTMLSYGLSVFD
jgi:hypothetical protein